MPPQFPTGTPTPYEPLGGTMATVQHPVYPTDGHTQTDPSPWVVATVCVPHASVQLGPHAMMAPWLPVMTIPVQPSPLATGIELARTARANAPPAQGMIFTYCFLAPQPPYPLDRPRSTLRGSRWLIEDLHAIEGETYAPPPAGVKEESSPTDFRLLRATKATKATSEGSKPS